MAGWVKLHRCLQENPLWLAEPFTRGQAWVDMLLLANHKPGFFYVRGVQVNLDRGQLGHSEKTLAGRWKWSRGKVRRFLRALEVEQQIALQKNNVTTLITIKNYDLYQSGDTATGATDRQQTDINKNVNNDKKKDLSPDALRLSSLLADLIASNNPNNRSIKQGSREKSVQGWATDIDRMLRLDERTPEEVERIIRWSQTDSFWQANILSGSALRKQFDKLSMQAGSDATNGEPHTAPATEETLNHQKRADEVAAQYGLV